MSEPLTLEAGKRYRTRDGRETDNGLAFDPNVDNYQFSGTIDGMIHTWTKNGENFVGDVNDADLVEVIEEKIIVPDQEEKPFELEEGKYYEDRKGNVTEEPLKKVNNHNWPYGAVIAGQYRSWKPNGRYYKGNRTGSEDLVKVVEEEPSDSGLLNKTTGKPQAPLPPTGVAEALANVIAANQVLETVELIAGEWYSVRELSTPALYAGKTEGHDTWVAKNNEGSSTPIVYIALTVVKHLPKCCSHDYKEKSTQEEVLDDMGIEVQDMKNQGYRRFVLEPTESDEGDYFVLSPRFNATHLRAIANYIEYLEGAKK